MKKTVLLSTLISSSSEIFIHVNGRRIKLSECNAKIELYEQRTQINSVGGKGIRKRKVSLVICDNVGSETCNLEDISGFDVSVELLRTDGIYERVILSDLSIDEIEEFGEWRFEVTDHKQIKRLFEFAS